MKMLLEVNQVCKSFGSNQVLKDISFDVREGEVHALIGENGAGKSTLIKIIGGIYQADSGEVSIDGKVLHLQNPIQAMEHGISIVHQELSLAQNLSVAENIFMRRELVNGIGFIRWNDIKARSAEIFEQIGISIDPSIQVNLLSIGMQQVVEIAKAISMKARIIFMDEPTSSLSEKEISRLFTLIRELKRQKVSVVYISHKINEIIEISDRVSVLRDGNLVWTKDTVDITANQIISAMVGRELNQIYPQRSQSVGDSIMICEHLSRFGTFHDISFQVQRGEILGFYGLVGAGRSEVVRCIVGADTLTSGTITLDGKVVKMKTPRSALRQGVAYLSEDRKQLGLFLDFSAKDNIVSATPDAYSTKKGFIRNKHIAEISQQLVAELQIQPSNVDNHVGNLSGGNQQKVLLAKWILPHPKVLIVDEPTRGVDVGAKALIHQKLRELADEGMAIIAISSEMPEIMGISDRIAVFHEGHLIDTLDNRNGQVTQNEIMERAVRI